MKLSAKENVIRSNELNESFFCSVNSETVIQLVMLVFLHQRLHGKVVFVEVSCHAEIPIFVGPFVHLVQNMILCAVADLEKRMESGFFINGGLVNLFRRHRRTTNSPHIVAAKLQIQDSLHKIRVDLQAATKLVLFIRHVVNFNTEVGDADNTATQGRGVFACMKEVNAVFSDTLITISQGPKGLMSTNFKSFDFFFSTIVHNFHRIF